MSMPHDRTKVQTIVVHHLGDGKPVCLTPEALKGRANPPQPGFPNGWEYPEYDFGILADGTVVDMRPLTVVGAHAQADKSPYILGLNWWNLNSASVVLGIDATKYEPPAAMVQGLIDFLVKWFRKQGGTMAQCYPHFQIFHTDCPGAAYSKLGLNTGYLNYNYVETSVNNILKGVPTVTETANKPCVLVFGVWDLIPAWRLATKLKCPVIPRDADWKNMGFNKFYVVGGPEETGSGVVNLTGDDWEHTTLLVIGEEQKNG